MRNLGIIIGKRSYRGSDISKDKYCGSGRYCDFYFKKYGIRLGETYIKEIIEINSNKKINSDREAYWIGDLWKTDPLCKNLYPEVIDRKTMCSKKQWYSMICLETKLLDTNLN